MCKCNRGFYALVACEHKMSLFYMCCIAGSSTPFVKCRFPWYRYTAVKESLLNLQLYTASYRPELWLLEGCSIFLLLPICILIQVTHQGVPEIIVLMSS